MRAPRVVPLNSVLWRVSPAVGVLLSGREDTEIQDYFRTSAFPDERHVTAILDLLGQTDGMSRRELERSVNLRSGQIEKVLKFLSVDSPAPLISDEGKWRRTPIRYAMDHAHVLRLTQQRVSEWQQVQEYIDTSDCLMAFLARALDDGRLEPCGKCTNCLGHPVVPPEYPHASSVEAARYLRQAEFPLQCRIQVAPDAFQAYGFTGNLGKDLRAEPGRVLSVWGDAGWGHVVAHDKHAGHFRDELADAVAEMVRRRWRPLPAPVWVTCVPSLQHPDLVPDLARGVAARLQLPYVNAVTKVRVNEPQKLQQNRYHQCVNLDGAFDVELGALAGPVLLLDDVVDSGWTMTVVAALLRRAGVVAVWPVALAAATAGD